MKLKIESKKFILIFISLVLILSSFTTSLARGSAPNIQSRAVILMDNATGRILFERNSRQRMFPASTTKIVTAILAIQNSQPNDIVTVTREAINAVPPGHAIAPLQPGEELTIDQLVKLIMVHSANDAANMLAIHIAGSIEAFADMMNEKFAELGLTDTHFTNPSGTHDPEHFTTAYDLAIIMKYCMQNPNFRQYAGLRSCTIPPTNRYEERVFRTTNAMLITDTRVAPDNYFYRYLVGGKTGFTSQAGNCLVSFASKDGIDLVAVVLGAGILPGNLSGRFIETRNLFEYGFNNFTLRKLRESGSIATTIEVPNATRETKNLNLLISNDIVALIDREDFNLEFSPEIKIHDDLSAPIPERQSCWTNNIYN